jgi:tetratricopeptide (TPR) repeat protein
MSIGTVVTAFAVLLAPSVASAGDAAKEKADLKAAFTKLVTKVEEAKKAGPLEPKKCADFADDFIEFGRKKQSAEAIFNGGTLYGTCANDIKKAEAAWREALQINPNFAPAHVNLGELAWRTGKPLEAQTEFDTALKLDPKNVQAYNDSALMLVEKAKAAGNDKAIYAEAIGTLRRALAVDGDSMPAYGLLALIYFTVAESDRSKLDLAALVCKQAKDVNPNYAPIYNTLGLINLRKRNVTGALQEFRKAAELEPGYIEAQLNIGAITLSARDYASGEKAFKAVLDANPKNPQHLFDATMGMGVAARGQRRIDEAMQWYQKAKVLDPRNCAVIYNLGVLWQDYNLKEDNSNLTTAKGIFNDFLACGHAEKDKLDDAKARIKIVDDTFKAIAEAKRMEEEAKRMQEEAARLEAEANKQICAMWKTQVEQAQKAKQPIPPPPIDKCDPIPGVWPPPGQPAPTSAPQGGTPPPPPSSGSAAPAPAPAAAPAAAPAPAPAPAKPGAK